MRLTSGCRDDILTIEVLIMARDYTTHGYWNRILNGSLCKFFIMRALRDGPAHGYEKIGRAHV